MSNLRCEPSKHLENAKVGPMILRTAVEDDEIFIDGRKVVVREGTHFILNIRDFHMDEEYFPSPSEISLDRYKDKEQAKPPKPLVVFRA